MKSLSYERILVPTDMSDFGKLALRNVLNMSGKLGADLIVIGAQHKWFSDATVIGTTTERITRFAKCPVLTVVRKAVVESPVETERLVEAGLGA